MFGVEKLREEVQGEIMELHKVVARDRANTLRLAKSHAGVATEATTLAENQLELAKQVRELLMRVEELERHVKLATNPILVVDGPDPQGYTQDQVQESIDSLGETPFEPQADFEVKS